MSNISKVVIFLCVAFPLILFCYLFFDYEVSGTGTVQVLSFPLDLPYISTKPIYPNPPGITISKLSTAPGRGARFSLHVDFNSHQYAELSLDGKKVVRIERDEPKNKSYFFSDQSNLIEVDPGLYQLSKQGEFLPLNETGVENQEISNADVIFSLVLGKNPENQINTSAIFLNKQINPVPKPAYLPLPFIRSFLPWKIEVTTDKGQWIINKDIYIWS